MRRGYPAEPFPGWRALVVSAAAALPGLFTGVIIIGGVLSGVFTVTESAAVGAIYAFVVALVGYRTLTWPVLKTCLGSAVRTTAVTMVLVGTATSFAYLLALYEAPARIAALLLSVSERPVVVLLLINLAMLVLGCVMDMGPLILICTPIFLPVVRRLGMDPVQFGMVMMMNLGLGLCTPPVGNCLFVGCAIAKVPIEAVVRTMWPFCAAILVALALTTYVPFVSLALPHLAFGG